MQKYLANMKAWISSNPGWTSAFALTVGLSLGLLAPNTQTSRANIPGLKEGFLLVTPTAKLFDATTDLRLRGSKVLIVHREEKESPPCKATHKPLLFSANERVTILSGTLDEIDSLLTAINQDDLRNLDLIDPRDHALAPCKAQIKIVYGEGDAI